MKGYIMTLLMSAIIISVLSVLLPEGNMKKYACLVSSVIISLSVITPFKSIFDFSEIFIFEEQEFEKLTRDDAKLIYNNNMKTTLKEEIETQLSVFGRAYVTISDDFTVEKIEIYSQKIITEEEKEEIKRSYNPERLDIVYDEHF